MSNANEESKGSTSSEEPEYESDPSSGKSAISSSKPRPLKIVLYLSTNLIVGVKFDLG